MTYGSSGTFLQQIQNGAPDGIAFIAAATLPVRHRGKVSVRRLLPEPIVGLEIERMELPAGASMSGIPHTPGTAST